MSLGYKAAKFKLLLQQANKSVYGGAHGCHNPVNLEIKTSFTEPVLRRLVHPRFRPRLIRFPRREFYYATRIDISFCAVRVVAGIGLLCRTLFGENRRLKKP